MSSGFAVSIPMWLILAAVAWYLYQHNMLPFFKK